MERNRPRARRYRLVLRGELGEQFSFLFEGMTMDLVAGNTVLTGNMIGQTHLHGLLRRTQELGFELISIEPAASRADDDRTSS